MTGVTSRNALVTSERMRTKKATNRMLPPCGVYEVQGNVLFRVLVPNLSQCPAFFYRNKLITACTEPLEKIFAYKKLVPFQHMSRHRLLK